MKKILISGILGQDGALLSKLLLEKGYQVYGTTSRKDLGSHDLWRLEDLGIKDYVKLVHLDLLNVDEISKVLMDIHPHQIYNLAAQSSVSYSFTHPYPTTVINGLSVVKMLDLIKVNFPETRFYQASSSEMFGSSSEDSLDENSKLAPVSPYAISKVLAHNMVSIYRKAYGIFACSGILFNHESRYRGNQFVTKKIVQSVHRIANGNQVNLQLGNMNVSRDWGCAHEYVDGMYKIINADEADDFVIASGKSHSLRDFVRIAFEIEGIELAFEGSGINEKGINVKNGKTLVVVNKDFFRPLEISANKGDYSKAKKALGWEPKKNLVEIIDDMLSFEHQSTQTKN